MQYDYEKTVQDQFLDDATVTAADEDRVLLEIPDNSGGQMLFDATQARALAKALKQAANVAEGKPAKAPKPSVIIDNDGDDWHLNDAGTYGLFGDTGDVVNSRAYIRDNYGIAEERP